MKVIVTWEFEDDIDPDEALACVEWYLDHGMSGGYDGEWAEIATYGPEIL